jgi:hypothetical protein
MANELGLRSVMFEVEDLQAIPDRLATDGYHLVCDVGQYEGIWRMAHVRGPEGIIVSLPQRIDIRERGRTCIAVRPLSNPLDHWEIGAQ